MSTPDGPVERGAAEIDDQNETVADEEDSGDLLPWQEPEQVREDRELANNALEAARKAFERVSRQEYGANKTLEPLGAQFDSELAQAIARLLGDVRNVLFEDPQEIWTGKDTALRYAVQLIPIAPVRELGKTLERILTRTLAKDPPEPREVTDLLPELVGSLHRSLERPQSSVTRSTVSSGVIRSSPSRTITTSERTVRNRWAGQLKDIEDDFRRRIRLASVLERAEGAAYDTTRARDVARQAAGQTGASTLGAHFAKAARREARLASQWTAFTIATVVGVVGIGSLIILRDYEQPWTEALAHLVIVLPIIGLASYTARIARHHRLHGRWSDTAAVQMESIPAFAEQLSLDGREQLILGMGASVFASPVLGSDDARSEHISAVPPDLIEALKAIVERLPKTVQ
ncbi:hypothetical protein V4U86_18085 [Mycobacterium sp. AMU20-3851]|uniref:hypothetical protein n=1 Tax=Mycobacterium sp. AMU20-3851 TaxID=3122055 RepID=UPI00375488CC